MNTDFLKFDDIKRQVQARGVINTVGANLPELVETLEFRDAAWRTQLPHLGEVVLTPEGFTTMLSGKLGFGKATEIFKDDTIPHDLKMELIRCKTNALAGANQDVNLRLRGIGSEFQIQAVMGRDFAQINNWDIIEAVEGLVAEAKLPDDLEAPHHGFHIAPNGGYMTMRLVSKTAWTTDFRGDPYYGVLFIENSEYEGLSFTMRVAVQRLACTNYAIGSILATAEHRWNGKDDFRNMLGSGAGSIGSGIDAMMGRLDRLAQIGVDYPDDMLQTILNEVGMGKRKPVLARAFEYLEDEAAHDPTAYDLFQAVTWATQQISVPRGKRGKPNFQLRNKVEVDAWGLLGVNAVNAHGEGMDINEELRSPEMSLREAIAGFLRGKGAAYQGETHDVLAQSADEVLVIDLGD
jgi:hypothetical protein